MATRRLPFVFGAVSLSLVALSPQKSKILFEERKDKKIIVNSEKSNLFLLGSNVHKIIDPTSQEPYFVTAKAIGFWNDRRVRDISISERRAAAIDENGNLYQWGSGFFGDEVAAQPELTLKGQNLVSVVGNDDFVFALNRNGKVFQLPAKKVKEQKVLDDSKSSWFPFSFWKSHTSVYELPLTCRIKKVSVGKNHIAAISEKGELLTASTTDLGNYYGQLGNGEVDLRYKSAIPEASSPPEQTSLVSFSQKPHSDSIKNEIVASRIIDQVKMNPISKSNFRDEKIVDVACGNNHTLALTASGRVYGFGCNELLQLGLGDFDKTKIVVREPTELPKIDSNFVPQITAIKAGGDTSFMISDVADSCEVFSFGAGHFGQLGTGQWTHISGKPSRIKQLSNVFYYDEKKNKLSPIRCKYITAGNSHFAAVMSTTYDKAQSEFGDNVYTWGYNKDYQLGTGKRNNSNVPVCPLPIFTTAVSKLANQPYIDSDVIQNETAHLEEKIGESDENFAAGVRLQLYSGIKKELTQKIYCGYNLTAIYQ